MPRSMTNTRRMKSRTASVVLFTAAITFLVSPGAFALITGGEGSKPIADPGWPKSPRVAIAIP